MFNEIFQLVTGISQHLYVFISDKCAAPLTDAAQLSLPDFFCTHFTE